MNILTRNFASTRPVQIATWTYKRYNLIVIFAHNMLLSNYFFKAGRPHTRGQG